MVRKDISSRRVLPVDIPGDWETQPADHLCSKITKGTTPSASEMSSQGRIPFIRVNNLTVGGARSLNGELIFVTPEAHNGFLARSIAYPGDILMNIVGPPLGKISKLGDEFEEYNLNQAVLIYRTTEKLENNFFYYYLNSHLAQQWFDRRAKKTSGQKNLTIALCKELPVPLPSVLEQQNISRVLTTWDRAIDKVEKLIENSYGQKNALMQQLLTGKARLGSFDKECSAVPLSDLVHIQTGRSNREDSALEGEFTFFDRSSDVRRSDRFLFDTEAIIVGGEGQDFVPKYFVGKFDLHQRAYALFDFKDAVGKYIFYSVHFNRHLLKRFSVGSTVASLRMNTFDKLLVWFPPMAEQQAIATVLSGCDAEIDAYCLDLEMLKKEKKALMQQLLTGKRRVKVRQEAA